MKIKIGDVYTVRKAAAKRLGIHPNVIAANMGGNSAFYALCLAKDNIKLDSNLKAILHYYLVIFYTECVK